MGWVSRSNPRLVEAIVASFSGSAEQAFDRLSGFTAKDWASTEFWLDTSGLALYFLDHLQWQGASEAVDAILLRKLQQKSAENKIRITEMLRDFIAINRSFRDAGIRYANVKGFTLFPSSCPDLSLRHQSDYDFLVDPDHLAASCSLLEQRGYSLTGCSSRSLEFKTIGLVRTSLDGQYRTENRRSAELHVAMDCLEFLDQPTGPDPLLNRLDRWEWNGECFPALSAADQFIGQALHIFGHLRNEHTRVSWLLEYRRHASARRWDMEFWRLVRTRAVAEPVIPVALGLATWLAGNLFGPFSSPEFDSWTVDVLPVKIRLWAGCYGRRAVLADVPGTKLYRLLEDALQSERWGGSQSNPRRRLIPLRRPDRMLRADPQETLRMRVRREWCELRFLFFRLRFHLKQGFRYALEARRWRRLSTLADAARQSCSSCGCSPHHE